jgi:hypothetical protein
MSDGRPRIGFVHGLFTNTEFDFVLVGGEVLAVTAFGDALEFRAHLSVRRYFLLVKVTQPFAHVDGGVVAAILVKVFLITHFSSPIVISA